jgi:hypothetical protein
MHYCRGKGRKEEKGKGERKGEEKEYVRGEFPYSSGKQ